MEYDGKIENHLKLEIDASTPPLPPNELSYAQRIMRKNFQDYIIEKNWRSLAASHYKTNNSYKAVPNNKYKTFNKLIGEFYSRWFNFIDRHIEKWNRIST